VRHSDERNGEAVVGAGAPRDRRRQPTEFESSRHRVLSLEVGQSSEWLPSNGQFWRCRHDLSSVMVRPPQAGQGCRSPKSWPFVNPREVRNGAGISSVWPSRGPRVQDEKLDARSGRDYPIIGDATACTVTARGPSIVPRTSLTTHSAPFGLTKSTSDDSVVKRDQHYDRYCRTPRTAGFRCPSPPSGHWPTNHAEGNRATLSPQYGTFPRPVRALPSNMFRPDGIRDVCLVKKHLATK